MKSQHPFLVLELSPRHMEQSPPFINVNVLASIHEGAVFRLEQSPPGTVSMLW